MQKSMLAVATVGMLSAAIADVHTVPSGTTESVTPANAEIYNAYDSIKVSSGAVLQFAGPGLFDFTVPLEVQDGGATMFSNRADVVLGANTVTVLGQMTVTNATLRPASPTGSVSGDLVRALVVGKGALWIEDGAVVTNRFQVAKGWESASVVQRGGTTVNLGGTTTSAKGPAIGYGGNAYFGLYGGSHRIVGNAQIGATAYGCAVFAMHGGTLSHDPVGSVATIRVGGSYTPTAYYQMGGASYFKTFEANVFVAPVVLAVWGEGTVFSGGFKTCTSSYDQWTPTLLTIGGGAVWEAALATSKSSSAYSGLVFVVNFNQATVRSRTSSVDFSNSYTDTLEDSPAVRNVIYKGGLVHDSNGYTGTRFRVPLRGPTGNGVTRIVWDKTRTYATSPIILIEGDGYGASAVPDYDPITKTVTEVRIVSPGCDYTHAEAYFARGDNSAMTKNNVSIKVPLETEIGPNENTGGLTINGYDQFYTWNSYGGPTVLTGNGIFECNADWALPRGTALKLQGPSTKVILKNKEFALKSIGGTGGEFRPDWSDGSRYTGVLPVECLDIETSRTLVLSSLTLAVTGRWDVAVSDLMAGKCADYDSTINFAETATVDVDGILPDDAASTKFVVAKATKGIVGLPRLTGAHAANWRIAKENGEIVLKYCRGMMLIVM